MPIYQTTSFTFNSTEHAANLFALAEMGNIYTRIMNPTQGVFEARMSASRAAPKPPSVFPAPRRLSGQAAELAILTICESGDHIVASAALYGGTFNLLHYTLPKWASPSRSSTIPTTSMPGPRRCRTTPRPSSAKPSPTRRTTSSTSPVSPHRAPARRAAHRRQHRRHPYLCRPIEHGADIVVHSATKYIGGHGTSIGGVIIDGGSSTSATANSRTSPSPTELPRPRLLARPRAWCLHHQGPRPDPA